VKPYRALLALLALQAAVGLPIGFWLFFSRFAAYDDESTFLLWDRHLLQGYALYDEVWSFHGPLTFLLRWLLHGLLGAPLTHEVYRFSSLALWLATALLLSLAVYRITRRLLASALAHLLVLLALRPLASEPGHPQGYVALLIAAAALLATAPAARRPMSLAAGMGVLAAALLLTKLNAGAFAVVGIGLAFTLAARRPTPGRELAAGAVALALPLVVMRSDAIRWPWSGVALAYGLAVTLSAALWLRPARARLFEPRALGAGLAGFAGGAVALVAMALAAFGSSLGAFLASVFVLPSRVPAALEFVGPLRPPGVLALVASLVLYGIVAAPGPRLRAARGMSPALVRAAAQVVYGVSLCALVPAAYQRPVVSALLGAPVAFLWLVMLPTRHSGPRTEDDFPRLLLALLAAAQTLYVYPISGSQVAIAGLLVIPCAVVCLDDGLRALAPVLWRMPRSRSLRKAAAALAALALVGAYPVFGARERGVYGDRLPLRLPGAERLRLPERSVALYRWISANLERHCDTYLSWPGLSAPYFWAGLPAPSRLQAGFWFWVHDAPQQHRIRDELERFPRACALLDDRAKELGLTAWRGGRPNLPLLQYLEGAFVPVGAVADAEGTGEWELRVRRGRRLEPEELTYAAIPVSAGFAGRDPAPGGRPLRELRLELPAFPGERAVRFGVVDLDRGVWIADSLPGAPPPRLRVATEEGGLLEASGLLSLDLSGERRLRLRWRAIPGGGEAAGFQVVRVYGASGELLAPVPVMRPRPPRAGAGP